VTQLYVSAIEIDSTEWKRGGVLLDEGSKDRKEIGSGRLGRYSRGG